MSWRSPSQALGGFSLSLRQGGAGAGRRGTPAGSSRLAAVTRRVSRDLRQPFPPPPARRGETGEVGHPGQPRKQTLPGARLPLSRGASGLGCSRALWLERRCPGPGRQCPRLGALPSGGLARARRQSCGALALPSPPRRGPSLYSGDSDIQRERLAQTAAPRSRGAGGWRGGPGRARSQPALRAAAAGQQASSPPPGSAAGSPQPRGALAGRLRARPRRLGSRAGKGRIRRLGRAPASLLVYGKVSRQAPGLHVAEQGRLSHV